MAKNIIIYIKMLSWRKKKIISKKGRAGGRKLKKKINSLSHKSNQEVEIRRKKEKKESTTVNKKI